MTVTRKKSGKNTKAKPRRATVKKATANQIKGLQSVKRELANALEQQAATSEILRVIASSPTDIQPVLETVAESAARLCEATNVVIYRVDGDVIHPVAVHGFMPPAPEGTAISRRTAVGRAIVDRQTLHIHDLLAEIDTEYPDSRAIQEITGTRTSLSTPLLREGISIGAIHVRRNEVRPFSENQIALLKAFADQAVIAIENVRLFQELTEALEQQTATSEILGVIASSPTDIQPVLDTVAKNAARLCDSSDAQIYRVEGDMARKVASHGVVSPVLGVGETRPLSRSSPSGRAIVDRRPILIRDCQTESGLDQTLVADWLRLGIRTTLAVPLLREGVSIGAIAIRRTELREFTQEQIALSKPSPTRR